MVRKPTIRNPLPGSNGSDNSIIDPTMPAIMEDYTDSEIPSLGVLQETLSPPSTLPPSPPPAPPSTLLASRSRRHHPHFTVTKTSRQSSHRDHSPSMFLQHVASPPLIVVHPPHIPVTGPSRIHVLEHASVLASN